MTTRPGNKPYGVELADVIAANRHAVAELADIQGRINVEIKGGLQLAMAVQRVRLELAKALPPEQLAAPALTLVTP